MAKKIVALTLSVLVLALGLNAEEAKVVEPKVGIEFTQRMDVEYVDGTDTASGTFGFDTLYSRSEIKGSVAYDLGGGLTLTPSVKDRLELRLNPGNLEGVDAGVETLGKIRDRNRVYLNLDFGIALDKAFNVAIGAEYRLATDLRTDKEGTLYPEARVTPTLGFNGKIDVLSYSLVSSLPLYLDTNWATAANDFFYEFEGTYGAGLTVKLDDANSLKLDLGEYVDVIFPTEARLAAGDHETLFNSLTFKVSLATKTVSPMIGFLMNMSNTATAASGVFANNVVGCTFGLDVKKDNWTFSFGGDAGVNTAKTNAYSQNPVESHLFALVKIKA